MLSTSLYKTSGSRILHALRAASSSSSIIHSAIPIASSSHFCQHEQSRWIHSSSLLQAKDGYRPSSRGGGGGGGGSRPGGGRGRGGQEDQSSSAWHEAKKLKMEQEQLQLQLIAARKRQIVLSEYMTVRDLSILLHLKKEYVLQQAQSIVDGVATLDDHLVMEAAELICSELGIPYKKHKTVEDPQPLTARPTIRQEDETNKLTKSNRPPVVTVMGHVDHGKTTLLDAFRKSNVAAGEAGGITQKIGAFSVQMPSGKRITFIDTPGHEAFSAMRAAGGQVSDMVVLVVAADDGVKPQTIEAIKHAQNANVPILVALNKIDKPQSDRNAIMAQLLEHGVIPEDLGGDVQVIPVSAMTGEGMDKLEEAILLQAEVLDLYGIRDGSKAEATIIESRVDKGLGPTATAIVRRGVLKPGQYAIAGTVVGRIRLLRDDRGKNMTEAGPGDCVEIVGLKSSVESGEWMLEVESEDKGKKIAEYRILKNSMKDVEKQFQISQEKRAAAATAAAAAAASSSSSSSPSPAQRPRKAGQEVPPPAPTSTAKVVPIIVRGDVMGSIEAILGSIEKLPNKELHAKVINSSVGTVTDADLALAESSGALIAAFNVKISRSIEQSARHLKVPLRSHNIIYSLMDDIKQHMSDLLPPKKEEKIVGRAEVLQSFEIKGKASGSGNVSRSDRFWIAGCKVTEGTIAKSNAIFRVFRDGRQIHECTKLLSLKRFKDDVEEVKKSFECGITPDAFEGEYKPGDEIVSYEVKIVKRNIDDPEEADASSEDE